MQNEKHFRAFISYSQQDKAWAKRIHTWLEAYRVPVGVVADVRLPEKLGRFFRDDEDMPAAADIAETVRAVLEESESLIVICSPRSAQSKWVNAEIHHFRRTGRARKVFAVIIDGVPNSGDPSTECFPPALRAAGDREDPDALPIEPMGLDVRKDGRDRICARLAAGLLDVGFDDLWQRDRRRRTRIVWLASSLAAAVAIALGVLSTLVLLAENNAARARDLASEFFTARVDQHITQSHIQLAARYALVGKELAPDRRLDFGLQLREIVAIALAAQGKQIDGQFPWDLPEAEVEDLDGQEYERKAMESDQKLTLYACKTLLRNGFRWFSDSEIENDPLLREYWPSAKRDVCRSVKGVDKATREEALAALRTPRAPDGELFLCEKGDVANAPRAGANGRVINYAPRIVANGVTLALNPAPYACLARGFGERNGRLHKGLDFTAPDGGPIYAAGAGHVIELQYRADYGNMVLIDHGNGVYTRYAHLAQFMPDLKIGLRVEADQQIGMMGNSAAFAVPIQLHYEVLLGAYDTPKLSFGLNPVSPFSLVKK